MCGLGRRKRRRAGKPTDCSEPEQLPTYPSYLLRTASLPVTTGCKVEVVCVLCRRW